eukprot:10040766-Ditylum_brightwellii.AAC.1
MYTDEDLFTFGEVLHSSCASRDSDGDLVPDNVDLCPDTKYWAAIDIDADGCSYTAVPTAAPTQCINNSDCDDGVACTLDVCHGSHQCSFTPDNSQCSNGHYCDTVEGCLNIDD